MAFLAVEMDMDIVVLIVMMAVAELVAHTVTGVFQHMHQMSLAESL